MIVKPRTSLPEAVVTSPSVGYTGIWSKTGQDMEGPANAFWQQRRSPALVKEDDSVLRPENLDDDDVS